MSWIIIPILQLAIAGSLQDPYRLKKPSKLKHVRSIIKYADSHNQDPYELLAISLVESSFRPKVVSSAGAIGLFQVMCKYWYKSLGYKTIEKCEVALFNPANNIKAGVYVLTAFRNKYPQCKGDLAYRCYYAGAGWIRRKGLLAKKIIRYEKKVRERREGLHKYYKKLIENIRANIKKRS